MYVQRQYLRDNATWTRNAEYREDLPKQGRLSSILCRVSGSCVSGATLGGGAWRLEDYINSLKVVANGSTVIKNLPGTVAQALAFYDQGEVAPSFWRNYATNTQFAYMLLNFGRYMNDPEYYLDLSRYQNVELQFDNTATSTYYGADLSIDVILYYLRGNDIPSSRGYFRTELWREWTTVANETKYLELPTEQKIRRILLQAIPDVDSNNVSETSASNVMYDVDLSLQTGILNVFKGSLDDLMLENVWDYGKIPVTHAMIDGTADKGFDRGIGRCIGMATASGSKDGAVSSTIPTVEADCQNNTVKFEAREADSPVHLLSWGLGYMNTGVFRFDRNGNNPAGLDPAVEETVQLNVQTRNAASAADGTARVILDRLVQ